MTPPGVRSVALGLAPAVVLTAESSAQAPRPGTAHARDVGRPTRAGCYQVSMKLPGTPRARRARYRGIPRSGSAPIHPDPDQDFLRVMPGYMPEGTLASGCLERPDRTQAHGAYSFPGNDPAPWPEVPQIPVKWSFTRRAR